MPGLELRHLGFASYGFASFCFHKVIQTGSVSLILQDRKVKSLRGLWFLPRVSQHVRQSEVCTWACPVLNSLVFTLSAIWDHGLAAGKSRWLPIKSLLCFKIDFLGFVHCAPVPYPPVVNIGQPTQLVGCYHGIWTAW